MKLEEKILDRMIELVARGEQIRRTTGPSKSGRDYVDSEMVTGWTTSCLHLLATVFGTGNPHYSTFLSLHGNAYSTGVFVRCLGILKNAKEDFERGLVFDLKELVTADVFDDFLEQAEHLIEGGYKGPAGVVAGCVLEDTLRKLCNKNGVVLPDRPGLDWMNGELKKKGVYGKLEYKQVTTWADIRTKAAHGYWDQFKKGHVEDMIRGVRRFVTDNPVS